MAQRDAIKHIESGNEGAFDHNVISDFIFGTNEEQLGPDEGECAGEPLAVVATGSTAEHDKRARPRAPRKSGLRRPKRTTAPRSNSSPPRAGLPG